MHHHPFLDLPLRSYAEALADRERGKRSMGQRLLLCDHVAYCAGYRAWSEFYRLYNAGMSPEDALRKLNLSAPREI